MLSITCTEMNIEGMRQKGAKKCHRVARKAPMYSNTPNKRPLGGNMALGL